MEPIVGPSRGDGALHRYEPLCGSAPPRRVGATFEHLLRSDRHAESRFAGG